MRCTSIGEEGASRHVIIPVYNNTSGERHTLTELTVSRFIQKAAAVSTHTIMAEAAETSQEIQVVPEEPSAEKPTDNPQATSQETQQQPKASGGASGGLFDLIKMLKGSEGKSKTKEANGEPDKYSKKMLEKSRAKKKKQEKAAAEAAAGKIDHGGWESILR
ncbi:uncharacterized protein LOC144869106 isoform X2 [Branchiostoma floridae x Branchiostoma japonicum]